MEELLPEIFGELLPETFRELLLEHEKYSFRELLPGIFGELLPENSGSYSLNMKNSLSGTTPWNFQGATP